ncbi:MAG: carbon storage regulator [Oscillospiraceae bacterium]|nr:carbon storage regulator [Oscillospiraceae bacterium]
MLCLNLKPGEYMTIGENVVIQLDRIEGDRSRLMIQAPKEISIVRGEVLERTGGKRPDCVFDTTRWHRSEIPWNRSKAQALTAMRSLLSKMDGRDDDVKALRRQLNHIFPPVQCAEAERGDEISNG